MQTSISQNIPYRSQYYESLFRDAYKLNTTIICEDCLLSDGNWDWCKKSFRHNGNDYVLFEKFQDGIDNSTKYVELKTKNLEEKFDKYIDAELKMVDLMRSA